MGGLIAGLHDRQGREEEEVGTQVKGGSDAEYRGAGSGGCG